MKFRMRVSALAVVSIMLSVVAAPTIAQSVNYPNKPIRIVVPFPAGGPTDIAARVIGQAIGDDLKTPIISRMAELGALPAGGAPSVLAKFQQAEQAKWSEVIQAANIQPH